MREPQPSGAFDWTQAAGGRVLQCRALLPYADHLFTTADLELRHNPVEWAAVAAALGLPPDRVRLIHQVHGVSVAISRRGDASTWPRPEADVIVSDDPASAIAVRVADCAPILIADSRLGVVAAAHAGWRGTVQRSAATAVAALGEVFGSRPGDLVAAIGPCLGSCCGEVGPEVVDAFRRAGHSSADLSRWFRPGSSDRSYLDLSGANEDQLSAAGVPREQIHTAALCTKSHPQLFHSYRAHGPAAGRMAAAIKRKK